VGQGVGWIRPQDAEFQRQRGQGIALVQAAITAGISGQGTHTLMPAVCEFLRDVPLLISA
jgi:hypothetical protein